MVVTDSSTGGLGIVFYVFFVALIGWKALPGKLMYENRKRIFETEFEEIIDIYKKIEKKPLLKFINLFNQNISVWKTLKVFVIIMKI